MLRNSKFEGGKRECLTIIGQKQRNKQTPQASDISSYWANVLFLDMFN